MKKQEKAKNFGQGLFHPTVFSRKILERMGMKKPQWFLPVRARLLKCSCAKEFSLRDARIFLELWVEKSMVVNGWARRLSVGGFFKRSAEKIFSQKKSRIDDEAKTRIARHLEALRL